MARVVQPAPFARALPFFYGWVVLAVISLGVFMSGPAQTYGVSVFIDPMLDELGWSRSMMSASYSLATMLAGLSMLAFGHLLDRVGARRIVTVLAFLYGAACLGMSTVTSPIAVMLGFAALRILGSTALVLSCTTLAALWFVRWRGRVMSITVLGMALSNAVIPPVLHFLVSAYTWRTAWAIVGVFIWISLIVPAAVLIRDRPEAVGLKPDGVAAPTNPTTVPISSPIEFHWTFQQAIRSRVFWLLVVATLTPSAVTTGLVFHQVSYFASVGLSAELSARVLSVYAIASAGMALFVGGLLDRVAARYVVILGLLLLLTGTMWLMVTANTWQAIIYGALLGAAGGTSMTTGSVLWPTYFGREHLGSIRGVSVGAMSVSAAAGPLILSLPHDMLGSYLPGLWILAALPLFSALAAVLTGPPRPPPLPNQRREVTSTV